jgi:hypothetical protein
VRASFLQPESACQVFALVGGMVGRHVVPFQRLAFERGTVVTLVVSVAPRVVVVPLSAGRPLRCAASSPRVAPPMTTAALDEANVLADYLRRVTRRLPARATGWIAKGSRSHRCERRL